MTEWIKRSERVTVVEFARSFEWAHMPGAGFSFDCTEGGALLDKHRDQSDRDVYEGNYEMCLRGEDEQGRKILDRGIVRYEHSYMEPGVIRCQVCSGEVELNMVMTNTCDNCRTCGKPQATASHGITAAACAEHGCTSPESHHEYRECGADYNSFGQRLAPREQWGWDTGESLDEILSSDWPVGVSRAEYHGEE